MTSKFYAYLALNSVGALWLAAALMIGCSVSHPDLTSRTDDSGISQDASRDAAADITVDAPAADAPPDTSRPDTSPPDADLADSSIPDADRPDSADAEVDAADPPDACVGGTITVCDGIDDDCDGEDELPTVSGFLDGDGDGYGSVEALPSCPPPVTVTVGGDCDDSNVNIHPGIDEGCGNVDVNCDGRATPCDCDSVTYDEREYLFCDSGRRQDQALRMCQEAGGTLVEIHSMAEQDWLLEQTGYSFWWIGLTDRIDEGTFVWTSGERLSYVAWHPGEPNDFGIGEDCAGIEFRYGYEGEWNDERCSAMLPAICEIE